MDYELERELRCRKRILAIYNKGREHFNSKEEWDDYLEVIEDIIWRLTNNKEDVDAIEAQIKKYRQDNEDQINATYAAKHGNLAVVQQAPALGAKELAAAAATAAARQPILGGGLLTVLPQLAGQHGAMVDAQRNIVYDWHSVNTQIDWPAAAAAGGWNQGIAHKRQRQEALASLLLR